MSRLRVERALTPFELERHPVGPQIAFLEHVGAHAADRGDAVRGDMIGAAIAVEQQVGDLVVAQELVEEHRPFGEIVAKIDRAVGPVEPVSAAQIDAMDGNAVRLATPRRGAGRRDPAAPAGTGRCGARAADRRIIAASRCRRALDAALQTPQPDTSRPVARVAALAHSRSDQNFGGTGKAGDGIEIARIQQQRRGDEFVERAPCGAPRGHRAKIARQPPTGIEWHPMGGHGLVPHQRFEPRQRRIDVNLVDHCRSARKSSWSVTTSSA